MSTIHLHQTTTSTPEQFVAGLTDFGPGRSKLFGNSADEYLKVHNQGPKEADVTEGSGGIWERLHYDWSDPNRVVMTTIDSNLWGGGSGHTYTFTRRPDGTTDLDAVVVREDRQGHRGPERRVKRGSHAVIEVNTTLLVNNTTLGRRDVNRGSRDSGAPRTGRTPIP